MLVFSFIGQLIVFFLCWRATLWFGRRIKNRVAPSLWMELVTNAVLAMILLIVLYFVHSTWWLVALIGGFVGVFCVQVLGKYNGS